VHSDFRYLRNFMDYYGVRAVDGILADLGVSFHHFDSAGRGFSFRFDGPLDMRMNATGGRTAADIVNTATEEDLARVLYIYGELKNSRQLARRIVAARAKEPVTRTSQLADIVGTDKKVLTLVFQALRIEVNDELGALREMLLSAAELLKSGGRIAVLTYHSLEDRIVKNFLRSGNIDGKTEKDFYGNILTPFTLIEKGLCASEEEVAANPRARSAKLRIAEKK
jgi:16S rRNA (cytosine1402-N4)-methyltransferase